MTDDTESRTEDAGSIERSDATEHGPGRTLGRRGFLGGAAGAAATGMVGRAAGQPLISTDTVSQVESPDGAPNIVVIMADDMGYSDAGCYGGSIRTPNIDRLADDGLRFTDFTNCSRCCPTRASMLTGVYPHQAGMGRMAAADQDREGYQGELTDDVVTIAEALGSQGYNTAMTGKWHLSLTRTPNPDHMAYLNNQKIRDRFAPSVTDYPVGRGFDDHYGPIWGVVNYFDPFSLVEGTDPVESVPDDYYITDAITDRSIEYIEKHAGGDDPLFEYVAYTAPHWPLHAPQETVEKYLGQFDDGWQATREERYDRMVEMGLIDPETAPLSDRIGDTSWGEADNREFRARRMAVHAAMIDRMDQGIGRIVDKLESMGELEDTLILFLSDNGASSEQYNNAGFDRPSETRDGEPIDYLADFDPMPGPETTFDMIGRRWANVSNTPWRFWKAEQYAGGVRTPMIAHWPEGLDVEPGSITHQPGHVIDILATCLDAAGLEYPETYDGRDLVPMEGKSLLPIFEGDQREGHDALFYEHFGAAGVRQGKWKLVRRGQNNEWKLYNVDADETETQPLNRAYPDKVEELEELWYDWATSHDVFPMPGDEGLIDADLAPHNRETFTGPVWRWHRGDDAAWREPDFDDGDWPRIDLPFDWTQDADPPYTDDQSIGWFRRTITIPEEWDRPELDRLRLPLGKIDSADKTYVNGALVGESGQFPSDEGGFEAAFQQQRNYSVPKEAVNFGGENVIAVRVYKEAFSGGIVGGQIGPIGRLTADELAPIDGISEGLGALWRFDGTTFDSSGGEPSETDTERLFGDAEFVDDSIEGSHSVRLTGEDGDYVVLADVSDGENLSHDAFDRKTAAMWIKPDSTDGVQDLYNEGGAQNGMAFRINEGSLEAGVTNGANLVSVSTPFEATGWTHVAVVFDRGSLTLYVDGEEAAANPDVGYDTVPAHIAESALGGNRDTNIWNGGGSFYRGKIDLTAVYTRALSADEVGRLADAVPTDPRPDPVVDGSPPTDPDGDGRYEDVDGDGELTYEDIVELFDHADDDAVLDTPAAYDFNGNGRFDFADIVDLFHRL